MLDIRRETKQQRHVVAQFPSRGKAYVVFLVGISISRSEVREVLKEETEMAEGGREWVWGGGEKERGARAQHDGGGGGGAPHAAQNACRHITVIRNAQWAAARRGGGGRRGRRLEWAKSRQSSILCPLQSCKWKSFIA